MRNIRKKSRDTIALGHDSQLYVERVGKDPLDVPTRGTTSIDNALLVLGPKKNLIIVSKIIAKNMKVIFKEGTCKVFDSKGKLVCDGCIKGRLFYLRKSSSKALVSCGALRN